ncbi:MAG: hypothetical protein AABX98_02125 [Nanoarchaeota archaeon]
MVTKSRTDVSVLLISGNEAYHAPQLRRFGRYLVTNAGIDKGRVVYLSGAVQSNNEILAATKQFIDNAKALRDAQKPGTGHHLVVGYHGHGFPSGFCPDGTPTSYYNLVHIIGFDISFLFINNSCYSGAAVEAFRECGLLPSFGSVIASTRSYKPSYGTIFLEELVASWKQGKEFRRQKMRLLIENEQPISTPSNASPFSQYKTYVQIPTRAGISLDHVLYPVRF